MKKAALILSSLMCAALLQSTAANALDNRSAGRQSGKAKSLGASSTVPFGGAYSITRNGKRPEELKRPSSTACALREQSGSSASTTRRDASGKVQVFGSAAGAKGRNGNIYADCSGTPPGRIRGARGMGKAATSYNRSTNTLNAATDGYVNRSATSSMMPKKAPSMYDPATGTLKAAKRPNAYQIYQQ